MAIGRWTEWWKRRMLRSSAVMETSEKDPLEARLGYEFRSRELLERALTHRSYANEQGLGENYERLELLGDSVLALLATDWLFQQYPRDSEGSLSKRKATLVSAETLAKLAAELGLGERLRLGVGEERSGGRTKASLLADALEAILGAIYLDGGLEAARGVLVPLLPTAIDEPGERPRDAKSRLQEAVQARGWSLPEYRVVAEEGPDHEKRFSVECWLDGGVAGAGEGASKKEAEQRAAHRALETLAAP